MHTFDVKTGTIFFAEIQNNAISCWNTKTPLKPLYMDIVEQSNNTLIYPNDLNVILFYIFYIKVLYKYK